MLSDKIDYKDVQYSCREVTNVQIFLDPYWYGGPDNQVISPR